MKKEQLIRAAHIFIVPPIVLFLLYWVGRLTEYVLGWDHDYWWGYPVIGLLTAVVFFLIYAGVARIIDYIKYGI